MGDDIAGSQAQRVHQLCHAGGVIPHAPWLRWTAGLAMAGKIDHRDLIILGKLLSDGRKERRRAAPSMEQQQLRAMISLLLIIHVRPVADAFHRLRFLLACGMV